MDRIEILGVILAGGESARMGGVDKGLALLGGKRLVDHVAAAVAPQVREFVVSGPSDYGIGAATVRDVAGAGKGPLYGLQAALRWATANAPWARALLMVPVDAPHFPGDLAKRLGDRLPALVSTAGEVQPTFGLWPVALGFDLDAWILNRDNPSIRRLAAELGVVRVAFPQSDFVNINTPEDLEKAAGGLGQEPSQSCQ